MSEQAIQQAIRLKLGKGRNRLWRNNTGALRDERGQLVRYGLCQGSADLIGIRTVTITPDMVGQHVGIFTAIEVKAPRGRVSPEQAAFLAMVREQGGIAGIARSVAEAELLLSGENPIGCGTVPVCQDTNLARVSCDQFQAAPSDQHPP